LTDHAHTNRLIDETSPYLLQHAHNPVDWYPWGEEALSRARAEDRPILLSIGYSACHWCHVMERESFEDEATAALMNEHFVSIKVDREERPDIDSIYMQAVQMMTQHGGWPMTMFLTPDGQPFWGGTYFPPEDRGNMPSFKRVLTSLAEAWKNQRQDVLAQGEKLTQALQPPLAPNSKLPVGPYLLDGAAEGLLKLLDPVEGGFGSQPKFPQPMAVEFLLRQWHRTGEQKLLDAVDLTLQKMARGGMYDQLGGGFARYSVDAVWLVPHFEKMLYDNAQLARAYLLAYQATGNAFYREIVEQTLDYVLRDMTDAGGGFYSTEDADSEGVEGKFYVWTPAQLRELLGEDDARVVGAFYDVTDHGNFEHGLSILRVRETPAQVAERLGVIEETVFQALDRARPILFEARAKRIRPGRDEKVLASWNGMMLRAFAEAARVLGRDEYLAAARANGAFLVETMWRDGRLHRTWKPGHAEARLNGYLEDYANAADGLIALYEATFEERWLNVAIELADAIVERFHDGEGQGFFDTASDHEELITRPKDLFDNATPSGNSVASDVLQRLALLTANVEYQRRAQGVFDLQKEAILKYPLGFARSLSALDFLLSRPKEVAIIGSAEAPDTRALLDAVFETFLPNRVIAGLAPGAISTLPLLESRGQIDGKATAYVCEQYTCLAPVTSPEELRAQLATPS
jgi:uncharacterized protein YyaL (SSP411 family)